MQVSEFQPTPMTFGRRSRLVTPDDDFDIIGGPVKAVVALTAGNLSVIPAESEVAISFIDIPAGFTPPFIVRRVMATGTTTTVATVED